MCRLDVVLYMVLSVEYTGCYVQTGYCIIQGVMCRLSRCVVQGVMCRLDVVLYRVGVV